jgi:hypothetical protein
MLLPWGREIWCHFLGDCYVCAWMGQRWSASMTTLSTRRWVDKGWERVGRG